MVCLRRECRNPNRPAHFVDGQSSLMASIARWNGNPDACHCLKNIHNSIAPVFRPICRKLLSLRVPIGFECWCVSLNAKPDMPVQYIFFILSLVDKDCLEKKYHTEHSPDAICICFCTLQAHW